jgi:filamentous hemagglutinin
MKKIAAKQMQLGIPANATADQMGAITQSVQYAQSKGISIIVTKVK